MAKTRIEWVKNTDGTQGYTINPVKGLCPVGCSYCYARAMYKRFKWNPEIRYNSQWMNKLPSTGTPSRIFIGSTMELFGDWIEPVWLQGIIKIAWVWPWHTFIFLTKQPQNLIKWSPFPDNVWLGVSATNQHQFDEAVEYLKEVEAPVKFISFEPLLERINIDL